MHPFAGAVTVGAAAAYGAAAYAALYAAPYDSDVNGRPMMSMKIAADPSPPLKSPSSVWTLKVNLSPPSFGFFSNNDCVLNGTILAED